MYTQYLGQYLLNKKLISADQLCELLAQEDAARVKLGVLAINSGFMTAKQVEEIHELQRTMDRRFGEIATGKGYLTIQQLNDLLSLQDSRHLGLSQAIVDKGYLTLAQLETALKQFKEDTQLTDAELKIIQSGDVDRIVPLFLDFPENDCPQFYSDYVALLLKNIVRFLNERPVLSRPEPLLSKPANGWLISQQAVGLYTISTGLILSDLVLLDIANRFSQESLSHVNDLAKDSICEFLNLNNGLFLINLSDKGFEFDLQPQTLSQTYDIPVTGYRIPIDLSCGRIELVFSIDDN
ncbi:MAG: bacteriophage adsorption protein [Firmicutes bacterium]|nr:bacteriophage adsorption protein [Bacillota bacterium]